MGLWRGTKSFFSKGLNVNVEKWLALDVAKDNYDSLKYIVKDAFVPKKARYHETFEESMERQGLTEEDIEQRKQEFTKLSLSFVVIGFLIVVYGLAMLFYGHYWQTIISLFIAMYAFSQAFRFHFWLFQLRNRKLGCTFKEWFNSEIQSGKPPKKNSKVAKVKK
jgi:intracellular multiplication protein IcmV